MKIVKVLKNGGFLLKDSKGIEFQLRSLFKELEVAPKVIQYLKSLTKGDTVCWITPTENEVQWMDGNILHNRERYWADWDIELLENELENYYNELENSLFEENVFYIKSILNDFQFEIYNITPKNDFDFTEKDSNSIMRWENSNSFFTPPMNFFIRCSQNKESAMRIEKYFKSLKVGDQLSWCEKVNEEISYENSNLNESLSFSLGDSEKIVAVDLHELEDSIDLFFI